MCGILIHFPHYLRDIKTRIETLSHRGLYSKTEMINGFGFGHVRLPINGLEPNYDCPYHSKERVYLYNGEIFNYKEYPMGYKADIEIWTKEDGIGFDGDYICVMYDKTKDELNISTDTFGRKQIYMRVNDEENRIEAIGSEIKSLLEPGDTIDMQYLSTVGKFGYFFNKSNTIVNNIVRMNHNFIYNIGRDGHINIALPKTFNSKFQLPDTHRADSKRNPAKDQYEHFRNLLELSIKRRLVASDIPIAVLYSGGLDSSILLYHIGNLINTGVINNIEIFTVQNSDDLKYAEDYAKQLNIKLNYIELTEDSDLYAKAHIYNECAVDLGSVIPKFKLFEEIKKKNYNVAIGGSGADEIFGGYKRMNDFDFQWNDIFNELVYYHLPRLEKISMANTIEYRTPYTADYIIDFGLTLDYKDRINKKFLRDCYTGFLPNEIINREKVPLKSPLIQKEKVKERMRLVKNFYDIYFDLMKDKWAND